MSPRLRNATFSCLRWQARGRAEIERQFGAEFAAFGLDGQTIDKVLAALVDVFLSCTAALAGAKEKEKNPKSRPAIPNFVLDMAKFLKN